MSTITGKDGAVYLGANLIGAMTEFNISTTGKEVDSTVMGAEFESSITTFKKWSGSMTFYYDQADTDGQEALDVLDQAALEFYPAGNASGKQKFAGTANLMGDDMTVSLSGMVTRKVDFSGVGALTKSTIA